MCSCNSSVVAVVVVVVYLSVYLQAWKRSYPARFPQFLNLTTSKTKQFCETSSTFELDNIKSETSLRDFLNLQIWQHQKLNETILRDFLQKWKVECRADGLVPMRLAIFPHYLSKVLRLPRKSDARSYDFCTCNAKAPSQNWRSDAPKCSPSQEISALTS